LPAKKAFACFFLAVWKLTETAGLWHQAMEMLFSNQNSPCLDVSFRKKLQAQKEIAGKRFFLQLNAFFCS